MLKPIEESEVFGYRPTCSCAAESVPGIVLDPMAGTGTVGAVANDLMLRSVCLDISREYMAHHALPRVMKKQAADALDGLPMFSPSTDTLDSKLEELYVVIADLREEQELK